MRFDGGMTLIYRHRKRREVHRQQLPCVKAGSLRPEWSPRPVTGRHGQATLGLPERRARDARQLVQPGVDLSCGAFAGFGNHSPRKDWRLPFKLPKNGTDSVSLNVS